MLSIHCHFQYSYYCDYLVQVWVHVLALKVRESVHFAHPFLEYVFALVRVNSYQNKNMHHMFYFWVRVLRQPFT